MALDTQMPSSVQPLLVLVAHPGCWAQGRENLRPELTSLSSVQVYNQSHLEGAAVGVGVNADGAADAAVNANVIADADVDLDADVDAGCIRMLLLMQEQIWMWLLLLM